jgi:beta-glucanase (GH16 family)
VVCVRLTLDELDALAPGEALEPTVPGDWRLTFHDEFAGTRVDETKWTPRDPWERGRNQELQAYVPEALEVRRGMLRAVAQRKSAEYAGTMRQYVSGMMNGAGKFNQRFGLFEIRCRVPRGKGLWPAFWLLPDEPPGWPPEIDVLEILGHQPQRIHFTHHWRDEQQQRRSDGGRWNGPDFSAGFHTIAAAWSDEAIVWYVDGVERGRSTKHIPAGRPMFMLINLAVGGTWPGAPDAQTSFPAAFEVDWVRVWERAEETKDR